MAFKETTTIISYTPEQVFYGLISHDFQLYVSDSVNAKVEEFSVVPEEPEMDETVQVNIKRTIDGDQFAHKLPSAVQRFASGDVNIEQAEAWTAAGDDGRRDADVTIKVPVAKATGTAVFRLYPTEDGSGTVVDVEGSVKSSIPLVGSKIAQMAEPEVGKMLSSMTSQLGAWLKEH